MSSNKNEKCIEPDDNTKMQDYPMKKRLRSSQELINDKQLRPKSDGDTVKSLDTIYDASLVESAVDEAFSEKPFAQQEPHSSSDHTYEPNNDKANNDPFALIELESPESPHKPFSTKPVKDMSRKEEKLRNYTGWSEEPEKSNRIGEKSIWDDLGANSQTCKHKLTWNEIQDFIFDKNLEKDTKIGILQDQLRFERDEVLRHKTNLAKRNGLIEAWRMKIDDLTEENESLKAKLAALENSKN